MNPIIYFFIFILSSTISSCSGWLGYNISLESGSKTLSSGANYSVEKTSDGTYIKKVYCIKNQQITHYNTYSDKDLTIKHGRSYHCYDNGTVASVGNYKIGHKHGQWTEDVYTKGIYLNSKKEGE